MTVRDAVAAASGVLPEAFLERVDIIRRKADEGTELLSVSLSGALSGDSGQNIVLADQDEIGVYTTSQVLWRDSSVRIEGAVQRPGTYVRSGNMRVSDLIFASGGLVPESGKTAELARTGPSGSTTVITIELAEGKLAPEQDGLLQDRDVLTVTAVNPSLRTPEVVYVTGEVAKPGPYALRSRNERLSELIERAGGLTESANIDGLLFVRPTSSFENDQARESVNSTLKATEAFSSKQMLVQLAQMGMQLPDKLLGKLDPQTVERTVDLKEIESQQTVKPADKTVEKPYRPLLDEVKAASTKVVPPSAMGDPLKAADPTDTEEMLDIRRKVEELGESSRISIDLKRALAQNDSADNIRLRNGDRMFIPRVNGVVQVVGAVLHPHSFVVEPNKSTKYYIERSGGFSQNASRSNVIVIRPNGDAISARSVRFIQPDDTIVVPTTGLVDIAKKWEQVGSVTKVVSEILSSIFVLTRF
jgi:protein involved in polysaccharide export with SLBB domain